MSPATPTCSPPWAPNRACASCSFCFPPTPTAWWSERSRKSWDISASNLSHHLDKLKNEELVAVTRQGTFLRCTANIDALQELLGFLYAECCTRNEAVKPEAIITICK